MALPPVVFQWLLWMPCEDTRIIVSAVTHCYLSLSWARWTQFSPFHAVYLRWAPQHTVILMWRLLRVSLQNIHSGDRCRLWHLHIIGSDDDDDDDDGVFHLGLLAFGLYLLFSVPDNIDVVLMNLLLISVLVQENLWRWEGWDMQHTRSRWGI